MKKVFWLILAMCLLAVPAMAENDCPHEWGSCTGVCWDCGATGVTVQDAYCDNIIYEYDNTHHWGTCADCGKTTAKEVHAALCWETACGGCGAEGVTIGDKYCMEFGIEYEYDATHHWGVCGSCGKVHDKEKHGLYCTENRCMACGASAAELTTPVKHADVADDYSADDTHHWYDCLACGEKLEKAEHDFRNWEVVDEATCTEAGKEISMCFVCGRDETEREIPALGHTVIEWETMWDPAACTGEGGMKIGNCDVCGAEELESIPFEGEATGVHIFDSYKEMKPATCTEAGEEMSLCSLCGRVEDIREIPALGHDDSEMEVTKEATCEENGEKSGKCTRCGEVGETAVIPALGHDMVWETITEATCTEAGEQLERCDRCGAMGDTEAIAALGHDDGKWVVTKEATREEEGLKELHCTRCDGLLDSEVIPMVTVTHYPNNTACLDGSEFRDQENPVTDKWYTFLAIDLSEDGVQVYDLIASNMYRIGTVTLTVSEGTLTVDYELISSDITVHSEFLTLFKSLEEVTTVEQDAFTNYAYGEPIDIQEALQGTAGYIYLCNGVSYNDQIPGLVRVSGR